MGDGEHAAPRPKTCLLPSRLLGGSMCRLSREERGEGRCALSLLILLALVALQGQGQEV